MAYQILQNKNSIRITDAVSRQGTVTQPAVGSISIKREQFGAFYQITLTLDNVGQTIVNGTEYQSTLLYTFPEGRLFVPGAMATFQQKTTSALASTLNASSTGAISLGQAAASSTTLSGTAADIIPSTAFTSSATVDVAGTAVSAGTPSPGLFLAGQATPCSLYLNTAYATTTDVDGNATQTISGTIILTFIWLGDY